MSSRYSVARACPRHRSAFERLLSEGQFVATYKYALLVAIANLAVQLGADDGSEPGLPIRFIAEQFIELYWRQCAPYGALGADGAAAVLIQNTGQQAAIVSIVAGLQNQYRSLMDAKASPLWNAALTRTVPLLKTVPAAVPRCAAHTKLKSDHCDLPHEHRELENKNGSGGDAGSE
jgi:hypothetical protein